VSGLICRIGPPCRHHRSSRVPSNTACTPRRNHEPATRSWLAASQRLERRGTAWATRQVQFAKNKTAEAQCPGGFRIKVRPTHAPDR
jgi:hypothetical protein